MLDRLIRALLVIGGVSAASAWTWPGAFPEADPVAVLVRYHTPNMYTAVVAWYYVAPGVAALLAGQFLLSTSRIWFARMGVRVGLRSSLPRWPLSPTADGPAIVVGEVHHPVKLAESPTPEWLTIPERGLYTGVAIFGAVGSGKTSACIHPFARQLLSWQANSPERRPAALVLEVKGDFCHDIRRMLTELDLLKPFLPGLEAALDDPDVSEIMINGPGNVWLEGHGRLRQIDAPALDAAALERAAIHIARPLGLDPATTPVLDARLGDGSRVAICVPPASPHVAITVRRFGTRSFSAAQLVDQGALPEHIRAAAERTLHTRRNILVSGGTGSGKTTLLNALIALIPDDERIVAIEDTLELRIDSPNCVRFEARGLQQGAVTIRDLVRHALRHRPDHIVVGEVRGGEAADLLQALNTGHGGSLTTVHANNAESALSRLASCAMQGGGDLPWDVTCRGVVDGIAMVIHMTRADGRRFVEEAAYVRGYDAGSNAWNIERLDRKAL